MDDTATKGRPGLKQRLAQWARRLRRDLMVLFLAARHRLTPWYAKALAAFVVGYALSPIDLIPDFVPVLGYLDDLVLVPLGIALVIKLLPPAVLESCRQEAELRPPSLLPRSWLAAGVIAALWLMAAYGLYHLIR